MLSKVCKPQVPKSLSTISFSSNNGGGASNSSISLNNINVVNNNVGNNSSSGTQVFHLIRGDQGHIKPVTPLGEGSILDGWMMDGWMDGWIMAVMSNQHAKFYSTLVHLARNCCFFL